MDRIHRSNDAAPTPRIQNNFTVCASMNKRSMRTHFISLMGLACAIAIAPWPQNLRQQGFEVASIKPSRTARAGGEGSGRETIAITPNSVIIENAGLSFCIQSAYGVKFYHLRRETRTVPVYQLVVKSRAVKLDWTSPNQTAHGIAIENGRFVFRRVTMAELRSC